MTTLMLSILAVWFVAIFLGPPLWLAMALAGWAFLAFAGIPDLAVAQRIAQGRRLLSAARGAAVHPDGQHHERRPASRARIFAFAKVCVGWMRGGLCHANIVASVFFAGTSGSAVADAGGLGTLEIKAMTDEGYSPDIAAAVTASSATIGPIIPPSLPMIIYGVSAETSIGALFLAGVIPGLLMAGALMVMVRAISVRLNLPRHPFPGVRDLWRAFRDAFWALMTPVILFAGLFGGVFTPTEAAAIAVAYALVHGPLHLSRVPPGRPAADHPRHRRDHRRRDGARDDRVAARLLPRAVAGAADGRRLPHRPRDQPAHVPADRQRHPARRRLLHGGARGDADPDPHPRAGGDEARHRSGPVRARCSC